MFRKNKVAWKIISIGMQFKNAPISAGNGRQPLKKEEKSDGRTYPLIQYCHVHRLIPW